MREASYLHTGKRKAREGHYGFEADSELGVDYIRDAKAAQAMALKNRVEILDRVVNAINKFIPAKETRKVINRNHNHIDIQSNGEIIHRKGATHAEEGMLGVIPGNMRDGSFIVRGKGNPDSLCSSSHGAGRLRAPKWTRELVDIADFKKTMEDASVTAKITEGTKGESPFAYKNIFTVMDLQRDLVEIVTHVKPIINVKG